MKKNFYIGIVLLTILVIVQSCKKDYVAPTDFSTITATSSECAENGAHDTTDWTNDVLNYALDTALLTFYDGITTTDTLAGKVTILPPCPNPGNGFFIWNVEATRQCKLKLVCINEKYETLYYNAYRLTGEPMEIAFDFRYNTAFKKGGYYRMFYAFYNSRDSIYYAGHGDFQVQ
jgi:hypothetical protein